MNKNKLKQQIYNLNPCGDRRYNVGFKSAICQVCKVIDDFKEEDVKYSRGERALKGSDFGRVTGP